MGMGTLCTGKKAPIYGHGDTLHWQKGPYIWAWGHFALGQSDTRDGPYEGGKLAFGISLVCVQICEHILLDAF